MQTKTILSIFFTGIAFAAPPDEGSYPPKRTGARFFADAQNDKNLGPLAKPACRWGNEDGASRLMKPRRSANEDVLKH